MKKIKSLYRAYFQKSKVFLWPSLGFPHPVMVKGIQRGFTPVQTYLSWEEGEISWKEKKLICVFDLLNTPEFVRFNKELRAHKWFREYKQVYGQLEGREEDTKSQKGIYIFSLYGISSDWQLFINGDYSLLSPGLKRVVKNWFRSTPDRYVYIESFLEPQRYYQMYSQIIKTDRGVDVTVEELVGAVELCIKPDLEREVLRFVKPRVQTMDLED